MKTPRQSVTLLVATLVAIVISFASPKHASSADRPHVLWITLEDIGPHLGCYGDPDAVTPNIDRLAARGVRYTRASSNAGMCAVARATLITGMYPPSIGTMHMRSEVELPDSIRGYPEFLRRAGYFCSNHHKTDYNWIAPPETWDVQSKNWRDDGWRRRSPGQPFFTVINITDTHSSQIYHRGEANWRRRRSELPPEHRHDPAGVSVPPYYPDTPEVRGDLARYHDNISYADRIVGEILEQLRRDGLADDTIVFLFSDHGAGMPRSKSWCFESSLRVPLIIRFPDRWRALAPERPGGKSDRPVSFVDFPPTLASLCGVPPAGQFQGVAFLGPDAGPPRRYQFAYRDRMDERYELIRSVRDGRYKYIRNYLPHLPWFHRQTRLYPSTQPTYQVLHRMSRAGELDEPAATFLAHRKPPEQLFDLRNDPHETNNLADDPEYDDVRRRLRATLSDWMRRHRDLGFMPESAWQSRFAGRPPVQVVDDSPGVYPLDRILRVADRVGGGAEVLNDQIRDCGDDDPTVRYWAAIGLVAQPSPRAEALAAATEMLADPTPSCRIAAAEAVLVHDSAGDRSPTDARTAKATTVLVDLAAGKNRYARLLAINVLHRHADAVPPPIAQPLRPLLSRRPSDWIMRSEQTTVRQLLEIP